MGQGPQNRKTGASGTSPCLAAGVAEYMVLKNTTAVGRIADMGWWLLLVRVDCRQIDRSRCPAGRRGYFDNTRDPISISRRGS